LELQCSGDGANINDYWALSASQSNPSQPEKSIDPFTLEASVGLVTSSAADPCCETGLELSIFGRARLARETGGVGDESVAQETSSPLEGDLFLIRCLRLLPFEVDGWKVGGLGVSNKSAGSKSFMTLRSCSLAKLRLSKRS